MPRYVYRCNDCGEFERVLSVSQHSPIAICNCGEIAKQVITAPTVVIPSHMSATGVSAYESPTTGKIITNMRERRNDLAASGCIEYDPGMKQDSDRRAIDEEKALDRAVDETVEREFASMSGDKIEQLAKEVVSSELAVERI
jgi:putative FmdB family regulatory protein